MEASGKKSDVSKTWHKHKMAFLTQAANRGSISTGYDIDNSYKNENDNTERMYRAWGGITANTRTWTTSLWIKRTELGACYIWGAGVSGNDVVVVDFDSSDRLGFRSTKDAANDCVYERQESLETLQLGIIWFLQ